MIKCMLSFRYTILYLKDFSDVIICGWNVFLLCLQQSEEMYDPEIYRHQITEYYSPYVLDADIQAGEFNSNNVIFLMGTLCEFKLPPLL